MDFEIKDLNNFFNSIANNKMEKSVEQSEGKKLIENIDNEQNIVFTIEDQIESMKKTSTELSEVINKIDKHQSMETQKIPLNCSSQNPCDRLVPFCGSVRVPTGFRLFPILSPVVNLFTFDTSCLRCVIEPHTVTVPPIPNPCPGQPPITCCTATLNRVRIVGDIKFFANVGIITSCCFNGIATLCCSDTVCVDNIIGYTCSCDTHFDMCDVRLKNVCVSNVDTDRCGNKTLTIRGTFELPCIAKD